MVRQRVMFFAPFGSYRVHHQLDAVLALALRMRGHETMILGCDGMFRTCDVLAWSGESSARDCAACAASGRAFIGAFGQEPRQLRSLITDEEIALARRFADGTDPSRYSVADYGGVPIGDWVRSSVFTYFRIGESDLDLPEVRRVHKELLFNGLLSHFAVKRAMETFAPTGGCVFNARFAPYRVAFETLRAHGVPVIVHERGWADGTFLAYENATALQTAPIHDCARAWAGVPLLGEELERVKEYFTNREKGRDLNINPFVTYESRQEEVFHQLRIPPEARVLGFFTTGENELAGLDDYRASISQLDLIDRLIDLFRDRSDFLVIRHHPFIAGDGVFPPDSSFLDRAYRQVRSAPANVRVVMPSEKLSSYALYWNLDACIAPFSSTGVEALARGVPAACFEQSAFKEATHRRVSDVSGRGLAKLVDDLLSPDTRLTAADLSRLYRFQYAFISKLCVKFSAFGIDKHYEADIRVSKAEELAPGSDAMLDKLAAFFESGATVASLPDENDRKRDVAEERAFLERELEAIGKRRAEVRRARRVFDPAGREQPAAAVSLEGGGFVFPSRHARIVSTIFEGKDPARLREHVARLAEPYVAVVGRAEVYEEFFFSAAIDVLERDTANGLLGVCHAAWLRDSAGRIRCSMYGEASSGFDALRKDFPLLSDWRAVIAPVVFRRDALEALLGELEKVPPEALAEVFYSTVISPAFFMSRQPALVLG